MSDSHPPSASADASPELDPELLALKPPYRGPSALLSLSIIVFCAYVLATLWPDLIFSRQSSSPVPIDDMTLTYAGAESFVTYTGAVDHTFAMLIRPGPAADGFRLRPALGLDRDFLWILTKGNAWANAGQTTFTFRGRLRSAKSMRLAQPMTAYSTARGPKPRVLATPLLRKAVTSSAQVLPNVPLSSETPVFISELDPTNAILRVPRKTATSNEWPKRLEQAGIKTTKSIEQDDWIHFHITAPNGIAEINKRLVTARLFGPQAEPKRREHHVLWGQLSGKTDALEVASSPPIRIHWDHIVHAAVTVSRPVPGDSWILVTDEQPSDFAHVLPIFVLLSLLLLLFVWALARGLRYHWQLRANRTQSTNA